MIDAHSSTAINSLAARVAPLLALRMIKSTTTTKKAQAVLTAERVIIVCLLSDSPRAFMARIVPVAEVMPGMMDTRTPARLPVTIDKTDDFLVFLSSRGFSIICSGITGFVISEVKRVGVPKSPASAGNKTGDDNPIGESRGKSSITMPKIPERKNTNVANNIPTIEGVMPFVPKSSILPFSVAIISIEIAINTHSMISRRVE